MARFRPLGFQGKSEADLAKQDDKVMVLPGDTRELFVELEFPVCLQKGQNFAVREGGITIGAGVVVETLKETTAAPKKESKGAAGTAAGAAAAVAGAAAVASAGKKKSDKPAGEKKAAADKTAAEKKPAGEKPAGEKKKPAPEKKAAEKKPAEKKAAKKE